METLHLLVVDDEEAMCRGIKRALRSFSVRVPDIDVTVNFTVTTALTAEEAHQAIEADPGPDLVLLDHKLPDRTGLEVLDELNKKNLDLLTIVITAYASLETAVQATKRGAYDFMAKPFTPEEIRGTVEKAARHLITQRQARKLAEERRQVRFQFTSVLAHEMKSPISAIDGYLQVMKKRAKGEDISNYEPMIDRSLMRLEGMRKMINDLLDLTAIESGQKQREFTTIDFEEMLPEIMEAFEDQAHERNISLRYEVEQGITMEGDRSEIEIILNNLVSNGLKYNYEHGELHIQVYRAHGFINISVADTGIGLTEEEQQQLFQDFARIKNEKTRNIVGSGLGLSTVKKLATLYNGDVSVVSEPDKGTTFTVSLKPTSTEDEQNDMEQKYEEVTENN